MSFRKKLKPLRAIKHELRYRCGHHLQWAQWYFKYLGEPNDIHNVVNADHKLVLEGYGGSGNTFAWWTIRHANPKLPICHHLHIPCNVSEGLRLHLPVIVIIRPPVASVASLYSRDFVVYPGQGLRHYIGYYQKIEPFLDQVLVVNFEDIKKDMGRVVERCNHKFGTSFIPFEHTPENADHCRRMDLSTLPEDEDRNRKKQNALDLLQKNPSLQPLVAEANQWYERVRKSAN